jgi:hypothetical protein
MSGSLDEGGIIISGYSDSQACSGDAVTNTPGIIVAG